MKRENNLLEKRDWGPFVLLGVFMLIMHVGTKIFSDDQVFSQVLQNQDLLTYWGHTTQGWSSRIFITPVMILLCSGNIWIWRILDTLVMVLLGVTISKLFVKERTEATNYVVCCLVLIYPFWHMMSAGWIATTINYSIPLTLLLYAALSVRKAVDGDIMKPYEYCLYLLALLFAVSQEQCSVIAVCIFLAALIYLYWARKKVDYFIFIEFIISLAAVIWALVAPGNASRQAQEIITWFPTYGDLTMWDKLVIGINSTVGHFVRYPNLVFYLFGLFCILGVWIKYKNIWLRLFSCIPLGVCGFFFLKNCAEVGSLLELYDRFVMPPIEGFNSSWYCLVLSIGMLLVCAACIALIFKDSRGKQLVALGILAVGFATRVAMGFSPTVYASSYRTFCFMYFAILICILLIWMEILPKLKQRSYNALMIGFGALAVYNFLWLVSRYFNFTP